MLQALPTDRTHTNLLFNTGSLTAYVDASQATLHDPVSRAENSREREVFRLAPATSSDGAFNAEPYLKSSQAIQNSPRQDGKFSALTSKCFKLNPLEHV